MQYSIDPDEFAPMMEDCDLTPEEKRAWILEVVEFFAPLVDAAWEDDALAHIKAAQTQEKAAKPAVSMVDYSVHKQLKTIARTEFHRSAGHSESGWINTPQKKRSSMPAFPTPSNLPKAEA